MRAQSQKKKKLLGPKILPPLKKIEKILGPAFLSSSSQKAPIPAKNRLIYSVFSLLQTFKCLLGHNCTPGNVLLMRTCPPPSPARSCCIWTCPSIPAIPAPGAVWPTTGPKGHPSGWLVHPLSAHHHLPSPSSTPCMCMCIPNLATFLHLDMSIHPCQPSWRTFSPLISPSGSNFPMGGVLGTHHTLFPPFQLLHIHAHPLWPTWPPPGLCAHLCTLPHTSAHLACHFFLGFSYTHSTSCALAHFHLYPMAHG